MLRKLLTKAHYFAQLANGLGIVGAIRAQFGNFLGKNYTPLRSRVTTAKIRYLKHPIFHRMGTSDWRVFQDILLQQEYDVPYPTHSEAVSTFYRRALSSSKRPVIIDCGANIGMASVWYAHRFPEALIYAIEPEPENFSMLLKNCENYKNITPIQAAISDQQGLVTLDNRSDEPWAWETVISDTGTIPAITIPQLLARTENAALFIIKIDIEGFEIDLFRSNYDWIRDAPLLIYEGHDWLFPGRGTAHAILSKICEERRDYLQRGQTAFALSHKLLDLTPKA